MSLRATQNLSLLRRCEPTPVVIPGHIAQAALNYLNTHDHPRADPGRSGRNSGTY
jgi:hypothetical protein